MTAPDHLDWELLDVSDLAIYHDPRFPIANDAADRGEAFIDGLHREWFGAICADCAECNRW